MSYYPEPDSHIRATKKELKYATGVDTYHLAAKSDFITLKLEIHKLNINKWVNLPTSLNNLKTKVDELDVDKLKTVSLDLKKLSDEVDNELIKKTKFNTLKTKANKRDKNIPEATTLIHTNQCNTDKQSS